MRLIDFELRPLPPYRLDLTAWALKRRADNTWDRWDADRQAYHRLLVIDGGPVDVGVTQTGPPDAAALHVSVSIDADHVDMTDEQVRNAVRPIIGGLLGTGVDLTEFHRMAAADSRLAPLADAVRGLHPPRYPTLFEALTNAVTCQQITLTAGIRILARLADACGVRIGDAVSFPLPERVALLSAEELQGIGYSRQKARAMVELSALAAEGGLERAMITDLTDEEAVEMLRQLYGVGRWSAEYALLRGDGRLGIFPGDDVGVRKRLEEWLQLPERLDYAGVRRILQGWHPFGGMIYLHLLTVALVNSGQAGQNRTDGDG